MAAMLSFPLPIGAEMTEVHVLCLCPPSVCGGSWRTAANAVANTLTTPPVSSPDRTPTPPHTQTNPPTRLQVSEL